jgi:hypothetical protein
MATLNILKLSITSNSECPWIIFLGSCAAFTTKHHQWILSHGSQETIGETHMIGFESSVYSRQMCPETFQNPELEFFLSTYWAHSMGITVRDQSHNRKGFPHITCFSSRRTVTLSIVFTFQSPVLHPCLLQTAAHKVLGSVNNFYNRCIWLFGKNYVNKVCLWS